MKLLLDTHFLIWLVTNPSRITQREREVIAAASKICISVVTIWEMRIKWETPDRAGRPKGPVDPIDALAFARSADFDVATLTIDDVIEPLDPPITHRDPFDKMLLVHAHRLGARLLTRDDALRGHPLAYSL